jgi:flagellar assembly factor FliW
MLGFREVCPAFTIQKKKENTLPFIIITQNRDLAFTIENPPSSLSKNNTLTLTRQKHSHHIEIKIKRRISCLHTCLLARSLESITENKLGHPFIS